MKKLILLSLLAFFSIFSKAQDPIKIDTVIATENATKDEMFIEVSTWIAQKYNSAQDAVQFSDKEAGVIVCKGLFPHSYGNPMVYGFFNGKISYTLSLKFKDGKCRVTIDGFTHKSDTSEGYDFGLIKYTETYDGRWRKKKSAIKYWGDLKEKSDQFGENIISDISRALSQSNEDNW